ncbi:MAG: hypothetical protein JWM21_3470 [Acidobacteria bacterium]|nr:hypothetical protein [Acidobacteriota bacterium]
MQFSPPQEQKQPRSFPERGRFFFRLLIYFRRYSRKAHNTDKQEWIKALAMIGLDTKTMLVCRQS